ncbi:hypothetical protein NCCP1664_17430 [Zafaria cholistanensis]|uniref:Uncharacterized protein n=1 Tax=Zafaria cholistanensis TaxID=1682741 RepID=A0A5A7NTT2_9MICC|nr:hypothetical protein [Zafaria cholistanensis]GER23247.1 hypothetical protein NCCP1664_17430 [Zafaria cholistanensis]
MNGKLDVKVGVDLEGASARIAVRGRVDVRNVQALYSLAHRANLLAPGFDITVDLTAATAQPEVLHELRACADGQYLPECAGARRTDCRLHLATSDAAVHADSGWALAV